jgi:carbonic anhydrase
MELHLVHKSADGVNADVGVFLTRGLSSAPLTVEFQNLPADRYVGSLSTAPCREGVQWLLLKDVLTVSDEDLAQFTRRIAFNARPVQRESR